MGETKLACRLFALLAVVVYVVVPVLGTDKRDRVAEYDDVMRHRAAVALNRTLESYNPNPAENVGHINKQVHKMLKEQGLGENSTRRALGKRDTGGPCTVTNPIDACWRCDPHWANNRFRLADCVLGFGFKTRGGKGGEIYVVTDNTDDDPVNPKPGTLRFGATRNEPLWIIFERDMTISLCQELLITGDKTIDGRGKLVRIAEGAGLTIQFVKNVIIHGVKIEGIISTSGGMIRDSADHVGLRTISDGDGISMFGVQDVWIDHLSVTNCTDGIIDIVQSSTAVTVTNCHFTDHNHVMLLGASDDYPMDEKMQVTVAFNHFGKRLVQRMPRARFGFFHVLNNDYTHWEMYAIGGSSNPTIISQGNRFHAGGINTKEVTHREGPESVWKNWNWVTQGDMFLGGAYFVASGDQNWYSKHPELYDQLIPAPANLVRSMTKYTGLLGCKPGIPC